MILERFATERLSVRSWRQDIEEPEARLALEAALAGLLTEAVLAHLPPSMQLGGQRDCIGRWIDARARESEVLRVDLTENGALVGLLILVEDAGDSIRPGLHIGYLLGEAVWGQGLASELLSGLVAALDGCGPRRLFGGVDTGNPASARVLEKAGFAVDTALSSGDADMFALDIG
ncbi:GNAT family N-acetyltransferase [Tropicimonas sp. TH_r6]|uniref:GNAT family N-acetyltransferase n=1 Tax=Tropicimonas sp. TH_r6 TaxID=3082085 RepID=UPI002952DA81|nr:GNAT family N-acetyltransferase [Tropicimonas sp. TH_r6]MDV7141844.1 GNAT family N-acetyltransferase [Tropicimonas sp. TH_r6]